MTLTTTQTERLRTLLEGLPLAVQSPALVDGMARSFTAQTVAANQVIFDPTVPGGTLFLLAEGTVSQTLGSSGQPWYQRDVVPGNFFGQRSLISGQHETRAVATGDGMVYTMGAMAVSALIEAYPGLREVLWKDAAASRLRSIALFQSLNDSDINWLAQMVEVVPAPAGSELPIDSKAGLWIVDWGQVEIAGPAANLPSVTTGTASNEPQWIITAGNFFFTLQQGMHFGGTCAARWARTVRESQLFFLDERGFNRLLNALPAVRPLTDAPLDIPAALQQIPMFNGPGMTPAHRRHLAQICAWEFVPANQNISTQGTVGYSFVHLLRGAAMVSAVDDKGRMRPVNMYQAPTAYGKTSLLDSTRRDATVRAVQGKAATLRGDPPGAEILNLDRRDLQVAFAERRDLWHSGVQLYDDYRQIKEERPKYPWLDEGEDVLWNDRRHVLWLVRPLAAQALLLVAFIVALSFLLHELGASGPAIGLTNLILFILVFLPIAVYTVADYRDDYYAVTSRRVTRHDREPFASDVRIEAPLEMVQDVFSKSTLMGRVFDYGDVTVRTAAKVGALVFRQTPRPDAVVESITTAKAAAAVAARGSTKEALRQSLMGDLRMAVAVPDLDSLRALGANASVQVTLNRWQRVLQQILRPNKRPRVLPNLKPRPPTLWSRLLSPLPDRWRKILVAPPPRPPRPLTDPLVWQKHWINLAQRGGAALLAIVALLVAGLFLFTIGRPVIGGAFIEIFLPWLLLLVAAILWFAYHLVDWRNDLYIVSDEKIVDVEKKPLALLSTQRESSLEVIQTVDAKQNTFWSKLLNYGDVVIRTAAADEGFTFKTVPSPMLVQKAIFQKVDTYKRRQEAKRIDDRRRDVMEGLQVYHELSQDSQRRLP